MRTFRSLGLVTAPRDLGTYRTADGTLVHCVRHGDKLEIEVEDGPPTLVSPHDGYLVKLSDDPDWPDGWDRNRGGLWPTD